MSNEFTPQEVDKALYLPLRGGPKSPEASAALSSLFDGSVRPTLPNDRPTSIAKTLRATEALLGDLCRYRAFGVGGKHGMSPKDFPEADLGFGRLIFTRVMDALIAADFLESKIGWNYTNPGAGGALLRGGGSATYFRLSLSAVERLGDLSGEGASQHWAHGPPKETIDELMLLLRGKKTGDGPGPAIPFHDGEEGVGELIDDLVSTNEFLPGRVGGFAFAGLRRIYNDGDVPGKRWRRGGGFYSHRGGESYENFPKDARLSLIRLDGEEVAEVDLSASHLTILHAVHHLPFNPAGGDPYAVGEINREAVKVWVTTSLGQGAAASYAWTPDGGVRYFEKTGRKLGKDHRIADVRVAVIKQYPSLYELPEDNINSVDLAWHEAEIMRHSMRLLRVQDIPSLPVHDCLIVPVYKVEEAKAALTEGFQLHFESDLVKPSFKVSQRQPHSRSQKELMKAALEL